MNEQDLLQEYVGEIGQLVASNARHSPAMHEGPLAQADVGGNFHCPGCRLITLTKRLHTFASTRDDKTPQARLRGKSVADDVKAFLEERRAVEEPTRPQGRP